jgi:hypothetical protein
MANLDYPSMRWFGPFWNVGPDLKVPTPVGVPCADCDEKIVEGDAGIIMVGGTVEHRECFVRGVMGSVGHQRRECSCFGGIGNGDPPGMTRREASKAAYAEWERNQQERMA